MRLTLADMHMLVLDNYTCVINAVICMQRLEARHFWADVHLNSMFHRLVLVPVTRSHMICRHGDSLTNLHNCAT